MIIRNFNHNAHNNLNTKKAFEYNENIGIVDARRTIYAFVDKQSYETSSFTSVIAAIVNECVYDNQYDITHWYKRDNACIIRKGLYFGTIICAEPGKISSKGSFFNLDSAISSEKNVLPGVENVLSYGTNVFSTQFYHLNKEELPYLDIEYEVNSIPPQYYNEYAMIRDLGDWNSLNDDPHSCKINMDCIIDNHTTVHFMDISKYDTMRLSLRGSILNVENSFYKSILIPTDVGSAFNSYEGKGSIFIYDSDALGLNKCGVNVRGGYYPQGKFYHKKWVADNLATSLENFEKCCKDIEEEYGHIRVLYNPDELGNKFKFKFKDYNQSPITPLGKITDAGTIDCSKSDNTVSGIDNGYIIDKSTTDTIYSIHKANETNFMRQTQGW